MYICQKCGVQQPRHAASYKKILETRIRVYTDTDGRRIGAGHETVREIRVCGICAGVEPQPPVILDQPESRVEYLLRQEPEAPLVLDGVTVVEEEP